MKFGIHTAHTHTHTHTHTHKYIYIYPAYFVRSLCTEYCFKVRNYKILPRAETLRLCMTAKFNKNEMNIEVNS